MSFYSEIINEIKEKKLSDKELNNLKNKLAKKHNLKKIPSNADILLNASSVEIKNLKIITKPTRTLSGVAPIALMCKPHKCPHGTCTYCPGGPGSVFGNVPQSYTGREPSTMRSMRNNYDPYLVVFNRLEQFIILGQNPEKTEVIIQGGTFPALEKEYQEEFVMYVFKAMNDFSSLFYGKEFRWKKFKDFFELPADLEDKNRTDKVHKKLLRLKGVSSLEKEQKLNEKTKIRCVGLTIETKPDWGLLKHGLQMLRLGCTRVELGVQTLSEETLKAVNRGHTLKETVDSTRILKDLGFKINYHMMPGLPMSTKESDLKNLKQTIDDERFRPDMFKIYPTMVMKGTVLFKQWQKDQFKALEREEAADIISDFMGYVPYWVRVMRVQRDIPTFVTEAGVDKTNLRQYVEDMMHQKKISSKDIRAREAGLLTRDKKERNDELGILIEEYSASEGTEFFISMEDKKREAIYGYCRLRFPGTSLSKEITKDSAIVRELHVVGTAIGIGEEGVTQHKGIGLKLLKTAEEIAKSNGKTKIIVISGIGAREYYKKHGYKKEGPYMAKTI